MEILKILNTIMKDTTDISTELKADTRFEDLEIDDFEVVDFLMKVEEYFTFAFPEEKMLEMRTVKDVMDMIEKNSQEDMKKC